MNISPKTQNLIWIAFLVIYFVQKYVADMKEEFQLGYLINVGILVMLTTVIPYYLTRFGMSIFNGNARAATALILPVTFSAIGLAVFFFIFIKPYVPGLSLMAILPRSLIPGIIMTVILLPLWIGQHRAGKPAESNLD